MMDRRSNKGFSLVELVIVIAIMAVLVAVITPNYLRNVERARKTNDAYGAGVIVDVLNKAYISGEIGFSDETSAVWVFVNKGGAASYVGGASSGTVSVNEKKDATVSAEFKSLLLEYGIDTDDLKVESNSYNDTGDPETEEGWQWYCVYMTGAGAAELVSSAGGVASDYLNSYSKLQFSVLNNPGLKNSAINRYGK